MESLTARLPLLVTLDVPPARWAPAVEAAAYFVVAEARTNVVKHAGCGEAAVTVRDDARRLLLEVRDAGAGGADAARGGWISGMADRVAALGGSLTLASPPGGGTTVSVVLPLL